MALTPSWPGPTGVATTTDGRKALAGLIVKNTAGVARSGVFPRHANALVTARSDMNLDIGIFEGAAVQFGGPILLANDATAQLPAPLVSPGAGITNYYVIYAKQNESTSPGTDANNNRVFGAQLSTASFATARAALPAGALELATVQMPTGKTATNQSLVVITPTFQYTAASGGALWFRTKAEMDLVTNMPDGQEAVTLSTGTRYESVAGVWVRLFQRPGFAAVTLNANGFYAQTIGVEPLRVVRDGNRNTLQGAFHNAIAPITFGGGTDVVIGSIPAADAPANLVKFQVATSVFAGGMISIDSGGVISYVQPVSGTYNSIGQFICWFTGQWAAK